MVRAILLDPEAENPSTPNNAGKLREPLVRYVSLLRQLGISSPDNKFYSTAFFVQLLSGQHPLSAPSVFNFFQPDHSPAGEIAQAQLVAPEFQITTSTSIVNITNLIDLVINAGSVLEVRAPFSQAEINFAEYEALANDPSALVERLDIVFTHGRLSSVIKQTIVDLITSIQEVPFRAKVALYLLLVSPDYAVQL